uniref:Uncharacterized protein n=1 Tax=Steinernema glaseri TaxID=37863 RepID=A0A1I8ASF3_9BILA
MKEAPALEDSAHSGDEARAGDQRNSRRGKHGTSAETQTRLLPKDDPQQDITSVICYLIPSLWYGGPTVVMIKRNKGQRRFIATLQQLECCSRALDPARNNSATPHGLLGVRRHPRPSAKK